MKKLIFRIIGALFSSLIIVAVFMPFTKVDSQSLWDLYRSADMIYLPIMIVVFGSIGVLFFSLNVKTEFAYATSGAIIFFTIMQYVQALNNETVSTLGLGFYFLAVGGVITGLMAFLSNLRGRQKKQVEVISQMPSMNTIAVAPLTPSDFSTQQNVKPVSEEIKEVSNSNQNNLSSPIPELSETNKTDVPVAPKIEETSSVTTPQPVVQPQPIPEIATQPEPIPEVVEQPVIQPEPVPNVAPQPVVQPEPTPQVVQPQPAAQVNVASVVQPPVQAPMNEPIPEPVSRPNPVLEQFTPTQTSNMPSQPTVPNPSPVQSNSSSNMSGLDIFGNFK